MSVLTILSGTLLYTWVKSRENPPAPSDKEQADTRYPLRKLTSSEPGDDLSDEEISISDRSEIFSHDGDEDTVFKRTR